MSFGAIKKKTLKIIYLVTTHIFLDIENLGFYYFSDFLHIIFFFFVCVEKEKSFTYFCALLLLCCVLFTGQTKINNGAPCDLASLRVLIMINFSPPLLCFIKYLRLPIYMLMRVGKKYI